MLATGGTLIAAIHYLLDLGAADITAICIISSPEGLAALEKEFHDHNELTIVTAALDEKLNEKGYIVPGLGDAGDRLYGVV
jgi:uracil phosphoribosyltransferase